MKYLVILLLLFSIPLYGQMGEYRRIMEEKSNKNLETYYSELRGFQKNNVEFSNVYFQLGEVELGLFSDLDPIVLRRASRQYIYNAKNNYGLSKKFFDIKEAVKNPEWFNYEKIKDRDSLVFLIQEEVDTKFEDVLQYADDYEVLVKNYDKAVVNYLEARQNFIEINNAYESISDLFLNADDQLKEKVVFIGAKFDSCLFYLSIYRDIYQKMPYSKKRSVTVLLQDIEQFRMNGISPSNFLDDEISLWNYGKWAQNFSNLLTTEVDDLRQEIEDSYQRFLEVNDRLINGDECLQINIDDLKIQRIINLISKYDDQSILIDVFGYIKEKLKYGGDLVYEKNCNILSEIITDEILVRKARSFQNIFSSLVLADSAIDAVTNSPKNQINFGWFYDEYMPGQLGSKEFAEDQKHENNESFKMEVSQLYDLSSIDMVPNLPIRTFQIEDSLLIVDPISLTQDSLQILYNKKMADSLMLLIGKYKDDYWSMAITPDKNDYKIKWKNKLPGSVLAFKSLSDSSFIYEGEEGRWFVHQYLSGREKSRINLKSDSILNISYDELNNQYQIISSTLVDSVVSYQTIDLKGKVLKKNNLSSSGRFIGLLKRDQKLWLYGSKEKFEGAEIILNVYDSQFEPFKKVTYGFEQDLKSPIVLKNDDETVTLVSETFKENELVYSLLDYEGSILSLYTF